MMSLVHETLYGLLRDPYGVLGAAGLEPGQRVLEIGCGPGFFSLPAAEIVGAEGSLCALDVSPLAVEKVKQKVAAAGVTNVETRLANATQTGLPDQSFDLVFVFGFANPRGAGMESVFRELHRLLKPGGTLSVEGRLDPPADLFAPLERQGRIARFQKLG
jgi:demethylmenaquinone methyltransferase/2-methoxy-6-polyprenyl-1,4-benzoquinol methylase